MPPSIWVPFICRAWEPGQLDIRIEPGQLDNGIYLSYSKAPYFSYGGSHAAVHLGPVHLPGVGARPARYSD